MLAEHQSFFEIKWRLLTLLAIVLPFTLATKFIPTGNIPYDKLIFQSKMRSFLKSQNAHVRPEVSADELLLPIGFIYKNCDNYVIVLPPGEQWATAIASLTPQGYATKFRYKEYISDEQPKYYALFNELYNTLAHPTSQENRRQHILALIATPACMQTIQGIDWNQFWPS